MSAHLKNTAGTRTMPPLEDRRYGISEAAEMLEIPPYVLRQWEKRCSQLKPKRDRANRRYYLKPDIEVALRFKQLLRHDKMTGKGASKRITQEIIGEGCPQTGQEAIDLIDAIEKEVRDLLDLLNQDDEQR